MQENDENKEKNHSKESEKGKSSKKKNLFSNSIRDSIEKNETKASNMSSFVENLSTDKKNSDDSYAKNNNLKSDSKLEKSNSEDEIDTKKELSGAGQNRISLSKMEENKLKKIDPKYLTKSDIKYEDGSGKGRSFLIAGGIAIVVLLFYLIFFTGGKNQSKILLANSEITNKAEKPKDIYTFTLGKPLYLLVDAGDSFGVDKIQINIVEQTATGDNKGSMSVIGSYTFSVKPNWESVETHFQKDYFVKKGDYLISVSKPNGSLIVTQKFKLN